MVRATQDAMKNLQQYSEALNTIRNNSQQINEACKRTVEPMLRFHEQLEQFGKQYEISIPAQLTVEEVTKLPRQATQADIDRIESKVEQSQHLLTQALGEVIQKEVDKHFQRDTIKTREKKPIWIHCSMQDCGKRLMKIYDLALLAQTMPIHRCPYCERDLRIPDDLRIS